MLAIVTSEAVVARLDDGTDENDANDGKDDDGDDDDDDDDDDDVDDVASIGETVCLSAMCLVLSATQPFSRGLGRAIVISVTGTVVTMQAVHPAASATTCPFSSDSTLAPVPAAGVSHSALPPAVLDVVVEVVVVVVVVAAEVVVLVVVLVVVVDPRT